MRRDGAVWSAVGDAFDGIVTSQVVYDDGAGAALFVGGNFATVGAVAATNIARFDGVAWQAVGNGLGNSTSNTLVSDLSVFDEGAGPRLFAGGRFPRVMPGGTVANSIARWDGTTWTALGSGVTPGPVFALHAEGDTLYGLGAIRLASGQPSRSIAGWHCIRDALFVDGFESGNASAWSKQIP